jgi:uncharacterized protein
VKLSGIFVYPIKACAGISLCRSDVVARGLAFDRRYMIVDGRGDFISQRQAPQLCLVATAFDGPNLVVSTRGRPQLGLPRELGVSTAELHPYRLWDDAGHALRHAEGSLWFSANQKPPRPGDIVSFADGYPLLLISEASLHDLNSRLAAPLEMRRFRPNLVISDCEPYAEDEFASVRIGELSFRGVKRCERCVVTTIDPDTGERDREPLRTLARYRLRDGKVWFGMNLIHDGPGRLERGDAVYLQ